jgi:Secretion system C-terminal sorting domain
MRIKLQLLTLMLAIISVSTIVLAESSRSNSKNESVKRDQISDGLRATTTSLNLDAIQAIYETDFNSIDDWSIINNGSGNYSWENLNSVDRPHLNIFDTPPFMWVDNARDQEGESQDEWLISPTIRNVGFDYGYVSFDFELDLNENVLTDSAIFYISVDNMESWIELETLVEDASQYSRLINISNYMENSCGLNLAFRFISGLNTGSYMGIDNFRIIGYNRQIEVQPTTLAIGLDLNHLSVSGTVELINNGSEDIDYSAIIRTLDSNNQSPAMLPENRDEVNSVNGPVAQSLDEIMDLLITINASSIVGAELAGAIITPDGIYANSWMTPVELYKIDFDLQNFTTTPINGAAILWNEFAYDSNTGFAYTVSNVGGLYQFEPDDINNTLTLFGSIGSDALGLAYDYDNDLFYWSSPFSQEMGLYNPADNQVIDISWPGGPTPPYGLLYLPIDEDGFTIWCAFRGETVNEIRRYNPTTNVWDDSVIPFSIAGLNFGGVVGFEATENWSPGMVDIVTLVKGNGDNIEIYEGLTLGSNCDWMTVDPEVGTVPANGSVTLTITATNTGIFSDGNNFTNELRIMSENRPLNSTIVELVCWGDVDSRESGISLEYELSQNYPNPFNPTTSIKYDLKKAQKVQLSIFNMLGQEIARLVDGQVSAGQHSVNFDGSTLASGIYFYQIKTEEFTSLKKMVLTK